MSSLADLIDKPDTKKIILLELDIGQEQEFWTNWRAGSWFVNFNKVYPNIDSSLLGGVSAQDITRIGSVKVDGVTLLPVTTKEAVQTNDSSFFYDDLFKSLYVHCPNGDEPGIHLIIIGEAYGFSNFAGVYNNFIYEPRLKSIPGISKGKDPQFFGVVSFDGGEVTIDNFDGKYDRFAEDNDVFGNSARILLGFDDLPYSEFVPRFTGFMETIKISRSSLIVSILDKRKQLSLKLPVNFFDDTTYPNIKEKNVGKPIPIAYGPIKNAPVICTNEEESGPPANYSFLICDMTYHDAIKEITTVYVEGVAKTPSSTNLTNATFELADADYDPGDEVTVTFKGYVDGLGNLIENGLHVVRDLLKNYYGINFNSNFFYSWNEDKAPDIGLFLNKEKELIDIIGEIAEWVQGDFIVNDDGRYSFRIYDPNAGILQRIYKYELLEVPEITYDPTEVLTVVRVGYAKDWNEDEYLWYVDKSQEADIYKKFKTYKRESFETLLTTKADAQKWATNRLTLSGDVETTFDVLTKPQVIQREIGDVIVVTVVRPNKNILNDVKAEIVGIENDGNAMTVKLTCRLIAILSEVYVEHEAYYGDTYYGDNQYGITEIRSA